MVQVRDKKKLPVVLEIEQVSKVLHAVALLRHRVPLRLVYCCPSTKLRTQSKIERAGCAWRRRAA